MTLGVNLLAAFGMIRAENSGAWWVSGVNGYKRGKRVKNSGAGLCPTPTEMQSIILRINPRRGLVLQINRKSCFYADFVSMPISPPDFSNKRLVLLQSYRPRFRKVHELSKHSYDTVPLRDMPGRLLWRRRRDDVWFRLALRRDGRKHPSPCLYKRHHPAIAKTLQLEPGGTLRYSPFSLPFPKPLFLSTLQDYATGAQNYVLLQDDLQPGYWPRV